MVCQRVVRCEAAHGCLLLCCHVLLCACLLVCCCAAHACIPDVPSCNWYMTSTQPSNVILWKRVTIAQGYESNDVAP